MYLLRVKILNSLPDDNIVPSRLNANACIGAVCVGGINAAGDPVEISHTMSSPFPPEASHLPQTENAKVNIVD